MEDPRGGRWLKEGNSCEREGENGEDTGAMRIKQRTGRRIASRPTAVTERIALGLFLFSG